MDIIKAVAQIRNKFQVTGSPAVIPLLNRGTFSASLVDDGVEVSNLRNQPFLHWSVFHETICLLIRNGGTAMRGNAMNYRLGDPELPLDSIEGHIAHVVYGKQVGESVFRRITPIACILIWSGLCRADSKVLILL
jgi:hypothetical protein